MVEKVTTYYQLIPEKFLEKLPELEGLFRDIPGFSSDNLKQIISEIAFHVREENKKKTSDEDQNYNLAPLKIVYLRKLVPQADKYLNKLRNLGIIKRFGYARKGVSAFKYGFSKEYESKYLRLPLTNPKLLLRIAKFHQSMKKKNSKMYPGQNQFLRGLTIERESLEFIKQIPKEKEYNYALSSVTRILNGEIYYSVDSTSFRFHSNLTNLPKELRHFVRINGTPLSNVDVKNCQPYLSILLLTNPKKVSKFTKCSTFSLLLENLQVKQTEDVKRYVSLVVDGEIYEYLMKEFPKNGLNITSRDKVKRQMLIILFARNVMNPPARKIFKKLFPEVSRVFDLIRGNETGDKFKNFKRFAILLQRIESHIILNLILNRINKEHPGTIAVTIHDSVMTAIYTDQVEKVQKIMVEEFSKFVGFQPKIKVEGVKEEEKRKREMVKVEKSKERERMGIMVVRG